MSSSSTLSVGDDLGSALTQTPTAAATTSALATNAVTRHFSDLHAPTWFMLLSANISARTLLFHPIQLAISRKRVTREGKPPTVLGLIKASYRGGRTSAYGAACPKAQYDFGRGGVRGCYRGVGAALLCNLLGETSYLFTLEAMKEYVEHTRGSNAASVEHADGATAATTAAGRGSSAYAEENIFAASSYSAALGAMCGDLVALLLVSPLVIVCNRQMTAGYSMASANAYSTVPQTLRNVWGLHQKKPASAAGTAAVAAAAPPPVRRVERVRRGFSGLYQGLSAGLLRIPSSGCWWGMYTKSKEALYTVAAPTLAAWEQESREASAAAKPQSMWQHNWLLSPTDNPLLNALAGIAASTCTTLLFNPIAVIQTRQQALPPRFWEERALGSAVARKRTWRSSLPFRRVYHVANDLVRKEGVRGFFKGAPANVSVAVLDGVIFTLLFEFTKLGSDMHFLEKPHTE